LAWLALACSRPAFSADALATEAPSAPPAQISDGTSTDSQPEDVATFLGTGAAAAPAGKPGSSLRLAPIATRLGGSVGYDIEQRNTKGGNATLQQRMLLILRGQANSYIWQPWIAKVNSNLSLATSKSKVNDSSSSSNNNISGNAGLFLLPYSRFPFDANISRNQNYSGPGIGSLDSQTTLFAMNQQYRPRYGMESYRAGYTRSQTDSGGADSDRQTGVSFSMMSSRFVQQTIEADASRDRDMRSVDGKNSLSSQAKVHHRYLPTGGLSLENNANLRALSDNTVLASTDTRTRELNSTLSLQPARAPYSVIGSVRVNVSDQNNQTASSHSRSVNANLGASYRPSQYINMSASANGNETESNSVRTRTVTTSQNASASYPLAATNLGGYRYGRSISGSIGNRTTPAGSTQSLGLGANHSLSRAMDYSDGRLSLGLNQGVSVSESTRSQATSSLNHSGSANWSRVQNKTHSSLRLTGRDSRTLSRAQDSYQSIDMGATIREELSRYSTLSGNLSVQTSRQVRMSAPSAIIFTNSSAALNYNDQRAFGVPRLIFNSDLRTYSQTPIPVLTAPPKEQGPITWENTLTYAIGRLTAEFRVNMSRNSDGTAQSLMSLSLRRYF